MIETAEGSDLERSEGRGLKKVGTKDLHYHR